MGVSPEERAHLDRLADEWGSARVTHADILNRYSHDYKRYQYARVQWETLQADWWRGQANSVRSALLSGDARFDGKTIEERITIGKQRWGKSPEAKEIGELEQMWERWMLAYLQMSDSDTERRQRQADRWGGGSRSR
jgi:hypothetical protein